MRRRQRRRLLLLAFKTAGADKVLAIYLLGFFAAAVPIWIWEPNINTYGDSLWFCFASATSIGYGDFAAVTPIGRIITVILSVYSIAAIAIFTAVITSFFLDLAHYRADDSAHKFIDELTHLAELSTEELEDLSKKVRDFQRRKK